MTKNICVTGCDVGDVAGREAGHFFNVNKFRFARFSGV